MRGALWKQPPEGRGPRKAPAGIARRTGAGVWAGNALAIVRETEVGDEDTTSTGTNLVTLGVDTTLANWVSEEMIQLEEGNLTGRIVQILFRLASTLSDDVLDVSSFAHKMAEKISVKLQD